MLRFTSIFLLVFTCVDFAVAAERVQLFYAVVQVESQDASERDEAFPVAMEQVLGKLTGASVQDNPELSPIISQAQRYVLSFSYRANPDFSPVISDQAEGEGETEVEKSLKLDFPASAPEKQFLLTVNFADQAILEALRASNVAIWGSLRPSILSWVVVQRGYERQLLTSDLPQLETSFMESASEYGLVSFLPVGDLSDQNAIDMAGLWGLFDSSVSEAGKRYPHDAVLQMRVFEAEEGLDAKYAFRENGVEIEGRFRAADYSALFGLVNQEIASNLSSRYAIKASEQDQYLRISVSNVQTFLDYVKVVEHLGSLSTVTNVQLGALYGSDLLLDLELRASEDQFVQQLALAGILKEESAPSSSGNVLATSIQPQLYYQWPTSIGLK